MEILSIEQLDDLSPDELWAVASDTRITTEIRHEAILCWMSAEEAPLEFDPDRRAITWLKELRRRATRLQSDEVEEDVTEQSYRYAPYFDRTGRLIVEHNGAQYLVDSDDVMDD